MKKIEKQYQVLQKKGINISYSKFQEYYEVTRKAKAKLNRLNLTAETNNLIRNRTISNSVDFIKDKKAFDDALRKRKNILKSSFIHDDNIKAKREITRNIHKAFGYSKRVTNLINSLKKLSVKDLKKFMRENKDLYAILWYADTDLIEKLDFELKDFEARLKEFKPDALGKIRVPIGENESFDIRMKKPKKKKKKKARNIYEENLEEIRKLNPNLFKS